MKLSVIIPSYRDKYLNPTIDSLLQNSELGNDLEIIAVLDGYYQEVRNDPRVKVLHLHQNVGMRNAINKGVALSTGEYIMRTDEHCMFGPGYDRILLETIEDNWIVIPRRYKLDVEKWEVMKEEGYTDYDKLIIMESRPKFSGQEWRSRRKERKDILIDETMGFQGSCWVMKRTWWESVIGELQSEGYGTHYQDSVEMSMKTWQAGGKLMTNKNTWYAHKHRKFERTHNYGGDLADASFKYSLATWGDYYRDVIKPKWGI